MMSGGIGELHHSHPQTLQPKPPNLVTQLPKLIPRNKLYHSKTLSLYNSSFRRFRLRVILKTDFNPVLKIVRFFKACRFYIAITI